jgi:hypothetical protein
VDTCSICDGIVHGPSLRDIETGGASHPACVAERLPEDAIVALIAAALLALTPLIIVWAA